MLATPKQPFSPSVQNSLTKILLFDLLRVKPHSNSSWAWKSLLYGQDLIVEHISWKVGNGESISLLYNKWIPNWSKLFCHLILLANPNNITGSFLLRTTSRGLAWDIEKVHDIIPHFLIPRVLAINLPTTNQPDQYIWPYTYSGKYNIKSGHKSLYD